MVANAAVNADDVVTNDEDNKDIECLVLHEVANVAVKTDEVSTDEEDNKTIDVLVPHEIVSTLVKAEVDTRKQRGQRGITLKTEEDDTNTEKHKDNFDLIAGDFEVTCN